MGGPVRDQALEVSVDMLDTREAPQATLAPPRPSPIRRRRTARAVLWSAAAVVALGGGGVWWWRAHAPAQVRYTTAAVDRGVVARSITASGTVNPVLTIVVGSYVSGVIQDIACDYNTRVRRGQVCATIDPRPYQLAVDQARAALATAQAQLVKDQASLQYAAVNESRSTRLQKEGWLSPDAGDNVRAIRGAAAAQITVDQATIQQRKAALAAALVNLGYTRIVSPVDGTVVSRNVTVGQTVAASFQTPTLFLIAKDLTKMQVDTSVSESDIAGEGRGIKEGDAAEFTVEAFPGRPFKGVVSQIRQAPQTVQNVVTYDVVVAVDNPEFKLKPGMTATVRIVTDRRQGVLRAPNAALRYSPGGVAAGQGLSARLDRLWVLKDGKPVAVPVRTGLEDEAHTELLAGQVEPGAAVITGESAASARRPGRPSGSASATPRMPRF